MSKSEVTSKRSRKSKVEELFLLADKEWNRGKARSAFRLFHAAAKAGNIAAQVNLGCSYDHGIGVWRNQLAAFSWYKRACRRGDASAANKIGTIWGDEQKPQRAFYWFERAVS
jgi:TPR repeat protein